MTRAFAAIGIAIKYNHPWFTGIFPFNSPEFVESTVTSTFQNEGAAFSPSSVTLPTSVGLTADFSSGVPAGTTVNGAASLGVVQTESLNGDNVLGRFAHDTLEMEVQTPDPHNQVCVSFDLWIFGSWDSGSGTNGPDEFSLEFDNMAPAEYPDPVSYATATGNSEAIDTGFGTSHSEKAYKKPISVCETHTGPTITLEFIGSMKQGGLDTADVDDEGWAIDNLVVTVNTV